MSSASDVVGDPSTYRGSYDAPGVVANFHNLPRSGESNQISVLFTGDSQEQEDYVRGLFHIGIIIVCLFAFWTVMLLLFKCLGKKRVGFMSGAPFTEYDSPSLIRSVRYIFAGSGLVVILFSILLVAKGTTQLQTASDTIEESNQDVALIVDEFIVLLESLQSNAAEAIEIRDELVTFLNQDICPNQPGTSTEQTVRQLSESTLASLEDLENFVENDLQDLDTVLDDADNGTDEIDTALEETKPTTFQMAALIIPFVLITSAMLFALVLGVRQSSPARNGQRFLCIVHWLILPLFILLILSAVVGCILAAVIAQANSDVCSGGDANTPEAFIEDVLTSEFQQSDFEYEVISFYLYQCRDDNPLTFLDEYIEELDAAQESLSAFITDIEALTVDAISQECGVDFNQPMALLQPLNAIIENLSADARKGIELIGCARLVPFYRNVVHDGTCTSAVQAESWIFSSLIIIAFFGMVMIMLRAAYEPMFFGNQRVDIDDGNESYSDKYAGGSDNGGTNSSADDGTNTKPQEQEDWDTNVGRTHSTEGSVITSGSKGDEIEVQKLEEY